MSVMQGISYLLMAYLVKVYNFSILPFQIHCAICTACPAGTYRTLSDRSCRSCPPNTVTDDMAAPECNCISGFFRTQQEGPETGCTRKFLQ